MKALQKLAGQTAVYGISIVGRFLNYLLVPIYTRVFTPEQYGIVTEMYAYVAFLIVILTYGMETALFRYSSKAVDKNRVFSSIFISIISTSALFITLCSAFSAPIGIALGYPNNTEYVTWFAFIMGLDAISAVPLAKLREQNKAIRFLSANLINIGANIGLNLFFLVYCKGIYDNNPGTNNWLVRTLYDPETAVGYVFISNLIASALKLLFLSPEISKIRFIYDKKLMAQMLAYGFPLMIGGLAGNINETVDRVLLKHLLPLSQSEALEQLGIYGACYKVSIIITLFIQAFRFAAEPFFFAQEKAADAKKIYATVMRYFVFSASFIFLAIMLFVDEVMYFVGPEFREGVVVVPILLMANLFLGIYFNLSVWYKLSGQTRFGAYFSIFGALITLGLNYLWIPMYGYIGSAWATLICYASMCVVSYLFGRKRFPVKYNPLLLLGIIASAYLLYLLISQLHIPSGVLAYVIKGVVLATVLLLGVLIERKFFLKTDH